jgi:hypothetical protein
MNYIFRLLTMPWRWFLYQRKLQQRKKNLKKEDPYIYF